VNPLIRQPVHIVTKSLSPSERQALRERDERRRLRVALGIVFFLAALLLVAVGLRPGSAGATTPPNPCPVDLRAQTDQLPHQDVLRYAKTGPYAAGVRTTTLGGLPVEVWYPADPCAATSLPRDVYDVRDWVPNWAQKLLDKLIGPYDSTVTTNAYRDLPPAPGQHPWTFMIHGFPSYRNQSTVLTSHLASWGYVVISPDRTKGNLPAILSGKILGAVTGVAEVDDLLRLMDDLRAQAATPGNFFNTTMDLSRGAAIGHSWGGYTTGGLAGLPEIKATIPLAPAGRMRAADSRSAAAAQQSSTANKPVLFITGSDEAWVSDLFVSEGIRLETAPVGQIDLLGGGHLSFTDLCAVGGEGIWRIMNRLPVIPDALMTPLLGDGCVPSDLDYMSAYAVTADASVALLEAVLKGDSTAWSAFDELSALPFVVQPHRLDPTRVGS
jgi:dienelactone hydrolase